MKPNKHFCSFVWILYLAKWTGIKNHEIFPFADVFYIDPKNLSLSQWLFRSSFRSSSCIICWMTLCQLTHRWKTGAGSSNSFPDWSVLCKSLCYLCQYVNWYPSYYANFYRDYPKFGSWPNRSGVIGNINNFNVIFLLTVNGPTNSNFYGAGSTDLLVTWLYLTVTKIDYNLASVIGILIFIYMQKFIYY